MTRRSPDEHRDQFLKEGSWSMGIPVLLRRMWFSALKGEAPDVYELLRSSLHSYDRKDKLLGWIKTGGSSLTGRWLMNLLKTVRRCSSCF